MGDHSVRSKIAELAPWFHNLHLPDGQQTAPDHPLGDFPLFKWKQISPHLPSNLTGWNVLDIGCNAGFYSFELARRGASVTAIDRDPHYLQQARWAAKLLGLESRITFRQAQIYHLARADTRYDLVWFMGVFYHLRYPFLALQTVARIVKKLMVFQTLTMPDRETSRALPDLDLDSREVLLSKGWPKMAFIERRLANDPTNWWIPNHACVEAMLRSSGLNIISSPAEEIYLCEPGERDASPLGEYLEAEWRCAVGLEPAQPPDADVSESPANPRGGGPV